MATKVVEPLGGHTINTLLHRHTVKCLLSIFIPADSLLLFPVFHQRNHFYLGQRSKLLLFWEVLCRLLGRKVSNGLTPAPATSSCSASPKSVVSLWVTVASAPFSRRGDQFSGNYSWLRPFQISTANCYHIGQLLCRKKSFLSLLFISLALSLLVIMSTACLCGSYLLSLCMEWLVIYLLTQKLPRHSYRYTFKGFMILSY